MGAKSKDKSEKKLSKSHKSDKNKNKQDKNLQEASQIDQSNQIFSKHSENILFNDVKNESSSDIRSNLRSRNSKIHNVKSQIFEDDSNDMILNK